MKQKVKIMKYKETSITTPRFTQKYKEAINEDYLVGTQCQDCGATFLPPRPICKDCKSPRTKLIEITADKGVLLTYTTIYVAPPALQEMAPYVVGIVELKTGQRVTSIILGDPEELEIGKKVLLSFDPNIRGSGRLRFRLLPDDFDDENPSSNEKT